jgi:ADP-ribosylglycohydrolase
MEIHDRYVGCMIASAAGDALGAPVEFKAIQWIRDEYGERGITELAPAYGRLGAITDDTQMAMATARGLIKARVEGRDEVECIREEYLMWLESQKDAENVRGPGAACLMGLEQQRREPVERADNDSKGCGGVMRVHPVGLYRAGDPAAAFELGWKSADLTHGHQTSGAAAGAQAALVGLLVEGTEPAKAVQDVTALLERHDDNGETLGKLSQAVSLAVIEGADTLQSIQSLGEGWIAEEALAIGVHCFLHHLDDPFEGLVASVNHSGDSDSTGAICGALLGAAFGAGWLPESWLDALEHRGELTKMAVDLAGGE